MFGIDLLVGGIMQINYIILIILLFLITFSGCLISDIKGLSSNKKNESLSCPVCPNTTSSNLLVQNKTNYVCDSGSVVDDPSKCSIILTPQTLQEKIEYCKKGIFYENNACLSSLALEYTSPTICNELFGSVEQENCIIAIALKTGKSGYCELMLDDYRCYKALGIDR